MLSSQLSMKEVLKNCQYFKIYKQNKFHAQLSWAWKKFYNLGAGNKAFLMSQRSHMLP